MGNYYSKSNHYNLLENKKILVNFAHIKQKSDSKITLEHLNILLGPNSPKYSSVNDSMHTYIFCAKTNINLKQICLENNFGIGKINKQLIDENKYNSNFIAKSYIEGNKLYDLYLDTKI